MSRIAFSSIIALAVLCYVEARVQAAPPLDVDVVKAALHTATAEENGFIEQVVKMVNKGTLPRDLFDSTFIWARKKPRNKFQYFKHALILRAEQRGIRL